MDTARERKRVLKMPITAKKSSGRERLLAQARELSDKITKKTIAAGITQQELQKNSYKAFLNVKRSRRSGCS